MHDLLSNAILEISLSLQTQTASYKQRPNVQTTVHFFSQELCQDSRNRFFELSAVQTRLAATDSIVIGGQTRRVQSIMVFKLGWIEDNWKKPMEASFLRMA